MTFPGVTEVQKCVCRHLAKLGHLVNSCMCQVGQSTILVSLRASGTFITHLDSLMVPSRLEERNHQKSSRKGLPTIRPDQKKIYLIPIPHLRALAILFTT